MAGSLGAGKMTGKQPSKSTHIPLYTHQAKREVTLGAGCSGKRTMTLALDRSGFETVSTTY